MPLYTTIFIRVRLFKMYEHMLNWDLVMRDRASFTPKGIEDVYFHNHISENILIVIEGDRTWEPLFMGYYPYKMIPVYGF